MTKPGKIAFLSCSGCWLFSLIVGCEPSKPVTDPEPMMEVRQANLGPSLAGSQGRTTSFEIINTSNQEVSVEAQNIKACCGDIQCDRTQWRPGEKLTAVVTIKTGKTGPLFHVARLVAHGPQPKVTKLHTRAGVVPRYVFEHHPTGQAGSLSSEGGRPRQVSLSVFADQVAGLPELDGASLRWENDLASVDWDGNSSKAKTDSGLWMVKRNLLIKTQVKTTPGRYVGDYEVARTAL